MNQVKAEEELKQNTKEFVKAALNHNNMYSSTADSHKKIRKGRFAVKKFLVTAATVAACSFFVIFGYSYYNTPAEYISVDINPSVELGINAFNKVVSVNGVNEDGKKPLKENSLIRMRAEDAIEVLVKEADKQGFIAKNGTTVIAVTTISNNKEKAIQSENRNRNRIQQLTKNSNIKAIVYTDCSNLELRIQAERSGISPGKYKLISILKILDPGASIEKYKNAKVTDIIIRINDLSKANITARIRANDLKEAISLIRTAAQEINQIKAQEQNAGINQAQTQTQNRTQTQNQTQCQDQNQDQTQNQLRKRP